MWGNSGFSGMGVGPTTPFTPAFVSAGTQGGYSSTGGPPVTLFGTSTTPIAALYIVMTGGGARGVATVKFSVVDPMLGPFFGATTVPANGIVALGAPTAGILVYFTPGIYPFPGQYTIEWVYTPADIDSAGGGAIAGVWNQDGDAVRVELGLVLGASGTFGSSWLFPLPSGKVPDTSKMPAFNIFGVPFVTFSVDLTFTVGVIAPDGLLRVDPLGTFLPFLPKQAPFAMVARIPVLP